MEIKKLIDVIQHKKLRRVFGLPHAINNYFFAFVNEATIMINYFLYSEDTRE